MRPVRWVLAASAVTCALQLLPYATWQAPAPIWAVCGLAVASALWVALPAGVALAGRRAVITVAALGPRTRAAAHLMRACEARDRFEAASAGLGEPRRWVADARACAEETTWSVAVRAREVSALEAALSRSRASDDGPLCTEEQRLTAELDGQERLARHLTAQLVDLADVAERTAGAVTRGNPSAAGLTDAERGEVEAMQWFRTRLEALEQAWVEIQDPALRDPG